MSYISTTISVLQPLYRLHTLSPSYHLWSAEARQSLAVTAVVGAGVVQIGKSTFVLVELYRGQVTWHETHS